MKRFIIYTIAFVLLSMTMSQCHCVSRGPISDGYYAISFVNNFTSDVKLRIGTYSADSTFVRCEEFDHTRPDTYMAYATDQAKVLSFLFLGNKKHVICDTMVRLKALKLGEPNISLKLTPGADSKFTIEQAPLKTGIDDTKTIRF